jgi:membrane protease YdiL (CAAX protease family)
LKLVNPIVEELFWRVFLYKSFPKTEQWRWIVAIMYSSYHVVSSNQVVIWTFGGNPQTFMALLILTLIGRVFTLVKDTIGIVATIMLHSGLDIGVMGVWLFLLVIG